MFDLMAFVRVSLLGLALLALCLLLGVVPA